MEIQDFQLLFDLDLAVKHGHFVYVRGSEEFHDWYASVKERGAKGGKEKAKRLKQNSSKPLANLYPPTPTPTPTPTLSLTPKKEEKEKKEKRRTPPPSAAGVQDTLQSQQIVALFCQEYKVRYGVNYRVTGKDVGILKRIHKNLGPEVYERIVSAYFKMPDQWFLTRGHDTTTLESSLARVSQFEQSGKHITQTEIRQVDVRQANKTAFELAAERINAREEKNES